MKLDYLTDVEPDFGPMVRLYDSDAPQVELIRQQVLRLTDGSVTSVKVHEFPFVTALDGCQLVFRTGMKDLGIRKLANSTLECTLTPGTWSKVGGYMEPFLDQDDNYFNKHQWLDETFDWTEETSATSLLFSPHSGGYW